MRPAKDLLTGYFDNDNYTEVHRLLDYFLIGDDPVPLDELLYIAESTEDKVIIQRITAILMARTKEITKQLIVNQTQIAGRVNFKIRLLCMTNCRLYKCK